MSEANGREPFVKSRDSDANEGGVWLSAAEAALALNTSVRTVQKRAARGEYVSRTEGNRRLLVYVALPEQDANVRESKPVFREPDANALLDQLRSENAFLRSELTAQREAADVQKSELRRLMLSDKNELSELRQKLALTAAPEQTQEGTSVPHSAKAEAAAGSVWWKRFWKRGER